MTYRLGVGQAGGWIKTMTYGREEGDRCGRDGCCGIIMTRPVEDCTCHLHPPCGSCVSPREYCPECGWDSRDDVVYEPTIKVVSQMKPRPLDPSKIDYRVRSHTSSSQICEGVYPPGTTPAEVEKKVRGTFGGRFEMFRDGRFKYVAYTD